MSDVGFFALKAHYYHRKGNLVKSKEYVDKILQKDLKRLLGPRENEVLYGRAGYLSALAYVRLFSPNMGNGIIPEILEDIVLAGLNEGQIFDGKVILNWTWHNKVSSLSPLIFVTFSRLEITVTKVSGS